MPLNGEVLITEIVETYEDPQAFTLRKLRGLPDEYLDLDIRIQTVAGDDELVQKIVLNSSSIRAGDEKPPFKPDPRAYKYLTFTHEDIDIYSELLHEGMKALSLIYSEAKVFRQKLESRQHGGAAALAFAQKVEELINDFHQEFPMEEPDNA